MDLTCQQSLFITRFFLKKPSQPEINTPLKNLKKNEEESTTNIFLWSYFYIHHEAKKTGQCSFFSFTFEITMFFFCRWWKKKSKALMMQSCNEKCGQLHVNTSQAYISFSLSLHYNECIRLSPWYRFSTSQKAHLHFSRPASQHWKKKIYLLMQLPAYYLLYIWGCSPAFVFLKKKAFLFSSAL